MLESERQGIYATNLMDWLMFRRTFMLHTSSKPDAIAKQLAAISQPPPVDPTPFTASVSVAVAHTIIHTGLFEVHMLRGLPWGDHYSSMIAAGRTVEQNEGSGSFIRGEIQPSQRGITLYSSVITLMSLWISATAVSAVISPVATLVPVFVATTATVIITAVILALLFADLRHLSQILHEIQ